MSNDLAAPGGNGAPTGFDPAEIAAEQHEATLKAVERVLVTQNQWDVIAAGEELCRTKALLPHGAFTRWVKANLPVSDRTARTYIRAFHHQDVQVRSDNPRRGISPTDGEEGDPLPGLLLSLSLLAQAGIAPEELASSMPDATKAGATAKAQAGADWLLRLVRALRRENVQ